MHRLTATSVWYAYEATASFLWALPFTVTAYYFVTEVGMSPLQSCSSGQKIMGLSVFVFEVPTGIVADTTSRRLSIVIGNVVMGVAFVVVGAFGDVLADPGGLRPLGLRLDGLHERRDGRVARGRGGRRAPDGRIPPRRAGRTLVHRARDRRGVGLALVDIQLPIVLGGVGTIALAVFYAGWMPETRFAPAPREGRGTLSARQRTPERTGAGLDALDPHSSRSSASPPSWACGRVLRPAPGRRT